jgi:hypothetical protein
MGSWAAIGGILLWVIGQRVVVICHGIFCGEW